VTTAPLSGITPEAAPQRDVVATVPDAVATAHAEMLTDTNLQFSMEPMTVPEPPAWLEPLLQFLRLIAPLMIYVFWIGVIAIVILVLYLVASELFQRLPGRETRKATQASAPQYQPNAERARAFLEEADRLAKEGRYNEAMRVLLHRSIEDIERFFSLTIGPSQTSREISRLDSLSSEGRNVFSEIARAVEMSLFGGETLTADDFIRARAKYAAFARVKS
jgi:hypothetical protein